MEIEQIMYFRRIYANVYKVVWIVNVIAVMLSALVFGKGEEILYYDLAVVTLVLFLNIFFNFSKVKSASVLLLVKTISVIAMSAMFSVYELCFASVVMLLIMGMVILEMAFECDFTEISARVIIAVLITTVFFSENIVAGFNVRGFASNQLAMRITAYIIIDITMILAFSSSSMMVGYFEKKVFAQARLIDEVNSVNNQLIENQEKVKRTNEQLGIQKVKLEAAYNQIRRINAEVLIQNEIVKYISSSLDLRNLMKMVTQSIMEKNNVEVCTIEIFAGVMENKTPLYEIATKYSDGFIEVFSKFLANGKFSKKFDGQTNIVDNRVVAKEYEKLDTNLIGSMLCLPLVLNNETIGKLYVASASYDFFVDDYSFYETIVTQLMIAFNNVKMYTKMQNMAIRDGLTGIYNRRYLNEIYTSIAQEAIKKGETLAAALTDIDKFKSINDNYGHLFGDEVIRTVAKIIDENIKDYDGLAARYGGEEFVVVVKDCDSTKLLKITQKIHKEIMEHEFVFEGKTLHFNVSIGVSSYPATCNNALELLSRADKAMYYSKEHGRGRITVEGQEDA